MTSGGSDAGAPGSAGSPGSASSARRTFRRVRIALWLAALVVAAGWTYSVKRDRGQRREWDRTLAVRVVLLAPDLEEPGAKLLAHSLPALEQRLAEEMARHRGPGPAPFALAALGPVAWSEPLPLHPAGESLPSRARHAWALWRTLHRIDEAAGRTDAPTDARIYVSVRTARGARTFAEGAGALHGEVGLVGAAVSPDDATLALAAIAHELLHCLGATDKYDPGGHAEEPAGLVEPGRTPRYPQRFAEWMVGEVPVGIGSGRLPASLAELAVGETTAREIGWVR